MKRALKTIFLVLIILAAAALGFYAVFSGLAADLFWLNSEGYLSVFFNRLLLRAAAFTVPFLYSISAFMIWLYAVRGVRRNKLLTVLFWGISVAFGIIGLFNWKLLVLLPFGGSAGFSDPFIRLDAYFYMARLPLIRLLLFMAGAHSAALFLFDLLLHRGGEKGLVRGGKVHFHFTTMVLFIITVFLSLLLYFSNALEVLVSQPGVRLGVDYKTFFGYFLGASIWILIAIMMAVFIVLRSIRGIGIGGLLVSSAVMVLLYFGLTRFYPFLLNNLYVKPNELMVQRPFIRNRIDSTRSAFMLRFSPAYYPKYASAEDGISNVLTTLRIWDSDPYLRVINQIQSIKTYFSFQDVDVDAYPVPGASGGTQLNQVVIAARELNTGDLPAEALNWDNLHLRYTHGNGVVISPADRVDREGNPVFWAGDLDRSTAYTNLALEDPQIYFGEITSNYVIVHTTAEEFEYTASTNRITRQFRLKRGVPLNTLFKKLLYSIVLREKNILLSKYLTTNSSILYRRTVPERLKMIFPYLSYDPDPYLSIVEGRLLWIIDAYTVSGRFPLSEKYETQFGKINYIRNSVKATVDAYSGDVKFYMVDPSDPVASAYRFHFPKLFQKETPAALEPHFRYPYHLLKIQSEVLLKYHVDNEDSFYNGDDVWEIPRQIYGEKTVPFEPYYILSVFETNETGLLSNCRPHFSVIQPFTPRSKENLASWVLAYYSGGPRLTMHFGEKTTSSFGPMQIESRINQNDTMSSFFTLWGQKGSKTFRGSVKFIPLNGRIFYIEPIFLESVSMGIPQLVKIVGIYDGAVSLGNNYSELRRNILLNLQKP